MEKVDIYFSNNSELAEFEASQKGYRLDVYVKIHNNYYNVRIYDIVRLQQDFESEIKNYSYYAIEPNLIIVKQVTTQDIVYTIEELYKQKYFEEIKPVENVDMNSLIKIN